MMTDPIADLFTRIRNSVSVKQEKVEIPSSNLKASVVELLKEEGFIRNFRVIKDSKQGILRIYLKYVNDESAIRGVKRVKFWLKNSGGSRSERPSKWFFKAFLDIIKHFDLTF